MSMNATPSSTPSASLLAERARALGAYNQAVADGATDAQHWAAIAADLYEVARQLQGDAREYVRARAFDALSRADAALARPQALPIGALVRLPDGSVGCVESIDGAEAYVVHDDRMFGLGRGPWIFRASQLAPATRAEVDAYLARVDAVHGTVVS